MSPPATRALTTLAALALLCSAVLAPVTAAAADDVQVVIKDFMFMPDTLTVKAGATVTWANKDQEPHTVVGDGGEFRSGAMDTGETFSFRFEHPGTYHFACSIHPRMVGTIVVD
jgi:plastocyanin